MNFIGPIIAVFAAAFLAAKKVGRVAPFVVPSVPDADNPVAAVTVPSLDTPDATVAIEPQIDVAAIPVLSPSPSPVRVVADAVADTVAGARAMVFGTKYDGLIEVSALTYRLNPKTLYKLLFAESHFREDIITGKVRSSTGALGIAQFMPLTAIEELGSINAALDPNRAIPGAARYLSKLIRFTGSEAGGVAAYNWGMGNVKRQGLAKAPQETVNYVSQILGVDIRQT